MDYIDILKSAGYPEEVLIIDFESYYDQDYGFEKMSTIEYVTDPRFDFTGCGFEILHPMFNPGAYFVVKPDLYSHIEILKSNFGDNLEKITVVAKNCKFDITVLMEKFGINPPHVIDIDDLLRCYDARMSHHMKDVTSMFGLKPKGKTVQFKGWHYEDMDLQMRAALETYGMDDIDIERGLFEILLPKLTCPEIEIPVARHTLKIWLEPKFRFDFKKVGYLGASMQLAMLEMVDVTGLTKKQVGSNNVFAETLIEALPEGEVIPTKAGKPTKSMTKILGKPRVIPALAKDDVGFQDLLVHPIQEVRDLCKARQAVKSWPLHIKRIHNMANQATASGGLLRVPLNFYAAHTGRWGGGENINLHNLGGRGRAGSGTHPLIAAMRSLMATPDGMVLGISDSSQIEARLLAWFALQDDLTTGFANKEDIYSVFASELFQCHVYDAPDDDPNKREMGIKRGFGKDAILGCGYGMGARTFYDRCMANEDLRPLFESGEYNFPFIERLIKTYRAKYTQIIEFWKDVEKAFKWVIKYPHQLAHVSRVYDTKGKADGFRLLFFNRGGTVHLRLPSGRELTYRHCAIKKTTMGSEIRWHYGHLWGGAITENIMQSTARDLLAWWILKIEATGLDVIFHNHDEIISMFPDDKDRSGRLDTMFDIMCSSPDWARGLPLGIKGGLSDVYKK